MTSNEPKFAERIAELITDEALGGAACGWTPCSGCHETDEGYETGHYPYSDMFKCHAGGGCTECGGLGVVWEYWSESDLAEMAADAKRPNPTPQENLIAHINATFPLAVAAGVHVGIKITGAPALTAALEAKQ